VYTSQESLEDLTLMCKRVKIKRMVEEQQFIKKNYQLSSVRIFLKE